MKIHLAILSASLILGACSASGPAEDSSWAPTGTMDPALAALQDNSGKVESVHGENPKRYFIANLRALNALDKDGNGIWDDIDAAIEAKMKVAPEPIKNMDRRPIYQMVRNHQDRMQYMTGEQARGVHISLFTYSLTCLYAMVQSGDLPKSLNVSDTKTTGSVEFVANLVDESVLTSKERVLASKYADGLSSGGTFDTPKAPYNGLASCGK